MPIEEYKNIRNGASYSACIYRRGEPRFFYFIMRLRRRVTAVFLLYFSVMHLYIDICTRPREDLRTVIRAIPEFVDFIIVYINYRIQKHLTHSVYICNNIARAVSFY